MFRIIPKTISEHPPRICITWQAQFPNNLKTSQNYPKARNQPTKTCPEVAKHLQTFTKQLQHNLKTMRGEFSKHIPKHPQNDQVTLPNFWTCVGNDCENL